jgi:hypothetical protein
VVLAVEQTGDACSFMPFFLHEAGVGENQHAA